MKVLVTGAEGMLAKDLAPLLEEQEYNVQALPHYKLDNSDLAAVQAAVDDFGPELIINCAAYNEVDKAEVEVQQAFLVNGLGVQNMCMVCQERDIPLVHFSTDYVFDGLKDGPYTINDTANPLSIYGHSKLLGEQYIIGLLNKFYLIRTSWLFGHHGSNFIEAMLELGSDKQQVSVVNDQRGCPTWTRHLSDAVLSLLKMGRYGMYHITNSEPTTWFDFAREIFRIADMDVEVVPISSDQLSRPAKRPSNSVLDPFPLPKILGREMPPWKDALNEYMQQRDTAKKTGT